MTEDESMEGAADNPFVPMWQVEIYQGATEVTVDSGPVVPGPRTLKADGTIEVPLVYAPVDLRSYNDALQIVTNQVGSLGPDGFIEHQSFRIHREMDQVFRIEFQQLGGLLVHGLEYRDDGSAVRACWDVSPYDPHAQESGDDEEDEP